MARITSKTKLTAKAKKVVRARAQVSVPARIAVTGKSGPRLSDEQRAVLLVLLSSGQLESTVCDVFKSLGWGRLASSTISYYRKEYSDLIQQARASRVNDALNTGLALKSERVAALKDHAAVLEAVRFKPDKNGRMWNERAWRQTLEDIALEQGDRKPKEQAGELVVKVYQGFDASKV